VIPESNHSVAMEHSVSSEENPTSDFAQHALFFIWHFLTEHLFFSIVWLKFLELFVVLGLHLWLQLN
jgi:hypothetical protein